jgi:hypothetical protein
LLLVDWDSVQERLSSFSFRQEDLSFQNPSRRTMGIVVVV